MLNRELPIFDLLLQVYVDAFWKACSPRKEIWLVLHLSKIATEFWFKVAAQEKLYLSHQEQTFSIIRTD